MIRWLKKWKSSSRVSKCFTIVLITIFRWGFIFSFFVSMSIQENSIFGLMSWSVLKYLKYDPEDVLVSRKIQKTVKISFSYVAVMWIKRFNIYGNFGLDHLVGGQFLLVTFRRHNQWAIFNERVPEMDIKCPTSVTSSIAPYAINFSRKIYFCM